MLKSGLIALILLGFAWAYPPTRARMVYAARPALERMGPFGETVLTPVHRYSTSSEVSFIIDQILLARTEGKEVPDERTFQRWMSKRILTKNNGKDAWNHPYYLIRVAGIMTVGSVGQDGQRGTSDDIRKTIPF